MQYLNKTKLKDEYYFTDKNIEELLPAPIIAKNPYYRKLNMYLWSKEDVEAIVKTEDVKRILDLNKERKEKYRNSIKKTNEKKKELTKKEYTNASKNIRVTVISLKDLKIQTLNHIRNFKNFYRDDYSFDPSCATQKDIVRWEVNYIRHELTQYDNLLEIGYRKIGKKEGQKIIIEAIYKKIATLYPSLKDECERQLDEHLNRWDEQIKG